MKYDRKKLDTCIKIWKSKGCQNKCLIGGINYTTCPIVENRVTREDERTRLERVRIANQFKGVSP